MLSHFQLLVSTASARRPANQKQPVQHSGNHLNTQAPLFGSLRTYLQSDLIPLPYVPYIHTLWNASCNPCTTRLACRSRLAPTASRQATSKTTPSASTATEICRRTTCKPLTRTALAASARARNARGMSAASTLSTLMENEALVSAICSASSPSGSPSSASASSSSTSTVAVASAANASACSASHRAILAKICRLYLRNDGCCATTCV